MSSSTNSTPRKRPQPESSKPAKRRKTTWSSNRNIWNSADDWVTLVAESQLSTASISLRRPRPRGLQTLVCCATEACARSFKRIWEEPTPGGFIGQTILGEYWKDGWAWLPDHLKADVRDKVFRYWGEYVTANMLSEVFDLSQSIYLPAKSLPILSKANSLRSFLPESKRGAVILKVTHATSINDVAFAQAIDQMPNLEVINLKGCTLIGEKSVAAIIKSCPSLRKINLKGTGVTEDHVRRLLDMFSQQIESFKVDIVLIENVNETLSAIPLPRLTHLCLPGDFLNARDVVRIRRHGNNVDVPLPKPTPEGSIFDWPTISTSFPALTHLYLPRSFIPETQFGFQPNTLVKMVLGSDPPIPNKALILLLLKQAKSLRKIEFGYINSPGYTLGRGGMADFEIIGGLLADCQLESFKLVCPDTKNTAAKIEIITSAQHLFEGMKGKWCKSLKHLTIESPGGYIPLDTWLEDADEGICPVLETLRIPGLHMRDASSCARSIARFRNLRELDISGTSMTEDDLFTILDDCRLSSKIDLTSCRGVKVQMRRNIFKAWEERNRGFTAETASVPAKKGRATRSSGRRG